MFKINAAKAVILACGGYAGNAEMVKARNPIVPACVTSTNFNQNNTRHGHGRLLHGSVLRSISKARP